MKIHLLGAKLFCVDAQTDGLMDGQMDGRT